MSKNGGSRIRVITVDSMEKTIEVGTCYTFQQSSGLVEDLKGFGKYYDGWGRYRCLD